jgi:ribosome modulation factor
MEEGKTVYQDGVHAFERGKERADCPYSEGDDRRKHWLRGWDEAKRGDDLLVDGLP